MIKICNISKIFNENSPTEFYALKDISFEIKKGEVSILKGVSGSGKSTLLSLIAGFYKPTSGEIFINNQSVTKLSLKFASRFRRENIGFIFQNFNLIPTFTALENIILATIPDGGGKIKYAKKLLEKLGLQHKADTLAKNLSGGEQQRVSIARALINDPSIILADEPTANLDLKLTKELIEYFKMLKNDNKTIVIATHDPFLAECEIITSVHELVK